MSEHEQYRPESKQDGAKERAKQYYQEALATAQRISQQWKTLKERVEANQYLLSEDPELEEIYTLTHSPKTGIQKYFENQVKFIEQSAGGDEDAKSRMMYRIKEKMEEIEKSINKITT